MIEQPRDSVEGLSSSVDTDRTRFTDPLEALIEFIEEADRVLGLSIQGISTIRGIPIAIKALALVKPSEDAEERLGRAEEQARFAEEEMEKEFPLLHAHTVVAVWSALEASIPKFAAGWLARAPGTLARPAFEKIRVPVSLYEQMPTDSRMSYMVDAVIQDQRAGKPGIARYEALLDAIGFGGNVPDELRRDLLEMSQVRNLIVHQFGIVDVRFAVACPWLDAHPGTRFNVKHRDYCRYRDAVLRYVTIILERACAVGELMRARFEVLGGAGAVVTEY